MSAWRGKLHANFPLTSDVLLVLLPCNIARSQLGMEDWFEYSSQKSESVNRLLLKKRKRVR